MGQKADALNKTINKHYPELTSKGKILAEFVDYLRLHDCSKATIESYTRTITQFAKHVEKPPQKVTQKDLDRYKLYLKSRYSNNTLTPKISAINMFMKFLKKPYRLSAPRQVTKNKDPLTPAEVQQLLEAAKYEPRDHAILSTLYYSQLRRNEIINLNLDNIDWERQKIRVNKGKGNNYSTINIHPDALESIRHYLEYRETPKKGHEKALFLSRYGRRIGRTAIEYMVKKYAAKAGIKKRVYPHLFRISSITHMAENGANLEEIRRQSRHKDLKTITGYIQLADQHVKDVYMKTLPSFKKHPDKTSSYNQLIMNETKTSSYTYDKMELLLIQKLIKGDISNEAFVQAVNMLHKQHLVKQNSESSSILGYI